MAIRVVSSSGQISYNVVEYVLDTPADLPNLPTHTAQGSTAHVISNGDEYILNSEKVWIKQPISVGGGGGDCNCEVDLDDITITRTEGTSLPLAGLPAGSVLTNMTIKEILEAALYPYQPPGVSLALNPSTELYDVVSGSITSITLTATVTKKTSPITSVIFYLGNTAIHTVAQDVSNGGTFSFIYSPSTPIKANVTFSVAVSDGTQIGTASKNIIFIGQSYYGVVAATVVTPTDVEIKALNSVLKNTNDYTYNNIVTDYEKIVYAYPKSLGALTSILDGNNIQYIGSYTQQELSVDGIDYYVYILTTASAVTGFVQKYS